MKQLVYVTTNQDKFDTAKLNLAQFEITPIHERFELNEMQSFDGAEIVVQKAQQAYEKFGVPLLVNDDTWSIPALRGFPGTSMKQCNHFLQAADWIRLLHTIEDRRIFLISQYGYHDGATIHQLQVQTECYFLTQPQGTHKVAPALEVIARAGKSDSIAQEIALGRKAQTEHREFWSELASLIMLH